MKKSSRKHELKCWPGPFGALLDGTKTFEYRKNDRDFRAGDILLLREWDPKRRKYMRRKACYSVTYILHGGRFELPEGFCIMSVRGLS